MLEKKQVSKILDTMKERFPKADTTLEKTDPFHFLLSIILSAQATDVSVNKATPALFKAYATPADLAQADPSEVEKYIKTIGLHLPLTPMSVALPTGLLWSSRQKTF